MEIAQQLNNAEWCGNCDPTGMLGLVEKLPEQCKEAERIARSLPLPKLSQLRQVVILGMGGSAIGGDLVRALAESESQLPIIVNRDYNIPYYVGADSLVIASSYSGNTEETLAAYAAARERKAHIIAIATGGELAQRAIADGYTLVRIPGGISPRAAIGYSFVPLLVLMERLGILPSQAASLAEMVAVLENQRQRYGMHSELANNPAKQLAVKLVNKAPLILGTYGWPGMAAYRWKCQINENSKAPAFWNVFPELNHNETVGWEHPAEVTSRLHVVLLRDKYNNTRLARRIDVTKDIMSSYAGGISEFMSEGESAVARLFSLIYPGDFTSVYLAYLHGADPTPVKAIDRLKGELAKI